MKQFFQTIIDAISSFDFYDTVARRSFWKSLGFYILFLFLAMIARAIPLVFTTLPRVAGEVTQSFSELVAYFPSDLSLQWDGSQLHSSTSPQVVFIPAPLKHYFDPTKTPAYAGIITTETAVASPSSEALFTVTKTDVLVPTENGNVSQLPLSELLGSDAQTITKTTAENWQQAWEENKTAFLHAVQIAIPIIIYIAMIFQRSGLLLLEAIMFFVFRKFFGKPWSLRTSIMYTLFFFIPAEIIDIVAHFALPQLNISFFSLVAWVYFVAISLRPEKKEYI